MAADCEIEACGVLAVGRCHHCSRAFCKSHQAIGQDVGEPRAFRLAIVDRCSPCEAEIVAKKYETIRSADDRERAALAAIREPIERVVVAFRRHYPSDRSGLVSHVLSELWPDTLGVFNPNYPPWDSDEVARWFAQRAIAAGIRPDCTARWTEWRRRSLGRTKKQVVGKPEPAWCIPSGSTEVAGSHDLKHAKDAFVFTDGRFMPSPANGSPREFDAGSGALNGEAMIYMAQALDLA